MLTKTEELIYTLAGGGEKGELAVKRRREYLDSSDEWMQREGRELARQRFHPRKEKENGTIPILWEEDR